ncbi:MAG: LysE family translocator [Candidatus Dormiibacterota bacterium]
MPALVHNPGAFVVYILIASITPGPNNVMLTTVGVTKGHLAALKTAAGVSVGWGIQVAVCGLGLAEVIRAVPILAAIIEGFAIAYLLWIAWKLWHADQIGSAAPALGFGGAILFQWVNPKAITMSLSVAGLFVVHSGTAIHPWSALAVALAVVLLNYPCVTSWGLLGSSLTGWLTRPGQAQRFNRAAAIALVALVLWLVLE